MRQNTSYSGSIPRRIEMGAVPLEVKHLLFIDSYETYRIVHAEPARNESVVGAQVYSHSGEYAPLARDFELPARGVTLYSSKLRYQGYSRSAMHVPTQSNVSLPPWAKALQWSRRCMPCLHYMKGMPTQPMDDDDPMQRVAMSDPHN